MGPRTRAMWNKARPVAAVVVIVFVLIQFVPYGWSHSNPPIEDPIRWPSTEVERLARASCYDCHSNETEWPVYSYVAPMSWLVRNDVDAGREAMNFSNWDDFDSEADDAAEEIIVGSMPPANYVRLHPGAALNQIEKRLLIEAFQQLDDD